MGPRDLVLGELVQPEREALGAAAVVDEQDRRAVGVDQIDQLGIDRRPDRSACRLAAGQGVQIRVCAANSQGSRPPGDSPGDSRLHHRVDGDHDLQVELLADPGVDQPARPPWPDQEAADLLERVLRRRQTDPLHLASGRLGQPLERQRQVRPPLGRRHRVDLVDDARLGPGEQLLRAAGQHEVERLRRRDQDVGWLAQHRLALALGRVAGTDGHPQVGTDPTQGHAQVAVDVIGERLERRDVHEADVSRQVRPAALLHPAWLAGQLVYRPQERGQCLPRSGRRRDQDVLARRDRRPRLLLRRRGLGKRGFEPLTGAWAELLEGHQPSVASRGPGAGRSRTVCDRELWRSRWHIRTLSAKPRQLANSLALSNTSSIIGSVSLPVNVFCWLGWKQPTSV